MKAKNSSSAKEIKIPVKANKKKPLVTIITPAYNEEAILAKNLGILCDYMKKLEEKFCWEILVINDGSNDKTAEIADAFAKDHSQVRVHHHLFNKNLGGALQTGFNLSKGDFVIVMDLDLSYAPDHIEQLLYVQTETGADVVVASPYMKGGRSTAVPTHRLVLSKVVNRIFRLVSNRDLHTFTGMVRAYEGEFIRSLNLKSSTYSINSEIIYKSFILRKKVVEIPAHLDWSAQKAAGIARTSSIRVIKGIVQGVMEAFIFRPYAFFLIIGGLLMLIALYLIIWAFIHTFTIYPSIVVESGYINDRFSEAVAEVFRNRPHTFFVGGISLIVALQFLSIGFLSLQNKRYFDELFNLNSNNMKRLREDLNELTLSEREDD